MDIRYDLYGTNVKNDEEYVYMSNLKRDNKFESMFKGQNITYEQYIANNISMFNKGTTIDDYSISGKYTAEEMQLIKSNSQIKKMYDLVKNKKGDIYAFDTETLGAIEKGVHNTFETITEIGLAKKVLGDGGQGVYHSIAFGLSANQAKDAMELVKKWQISGMDPSKFTSQELSNLDRFSYYYGEDIIKATDIAGIGDNLITIKKLNKSNIYDLKSLYGGIGTLAGIGGADVNNFSSLPDGADSFMSSLLHTKKIMEANNLKAQRIGDSYGNSIFDKTIQFLKNVSLNDNRALIAHNGRYDLSVIENVANIIGSKQKLSEADYIDTYYSIFGGSKHAMGDLINSPMELMKHILGTFDKTLGSLEHGPATLESQAMANAINIAAHHAGSDSFAAINLSLIDNYQNDKSFLDMALNASNSLLKNNIDYSLLHKRKNSTYTPVLYANSSMQVNLNSKDFAYEIIDGKITPRPEKMSWGINRGNVYKINAIKQVTDKDKITGYMVDFRSVSKRGEHGMVKYYANEIEMEKELYEKFNAMYTGRNIPKPNSPISSMYISPKEIEQQRLFWESDTARRVLDSFYDINSVRTSKDLRSSYGGFETAKQYYSVLDKLRDEIGKGFGNNKNILAIQKGDYDELIDKLAGEAKVYNKKTFTRNFKQMTGRLIEEENAFNEINNYLIDSGITDNFTATAIAQNYMTALNKSINDAADLKITRIFSKSNHFSDYASRADLSTWSIDINGETARLNIKDGQSFAKSLNNYSMKIAKQYYPDNTVAKNVESFRVMRDIVKNNILGPDPKNTSIVAFTQKEIDHILGLFQYAEGEVTSTSNFAIANEIGNMLEQKGYTLNTSGINLKEWKQMLKEPMSKSVVNNYIDYFYRVKNWAGSKLDITGYNMRELLFGRHFENQNNEIITINDIVTNNLGDGHDPIFSGKEVLRNASNNIMFKTNLRNSLNNPKDEFYLKFKEAMGYNDENMEIIHQFLTYEPIKGSKKIASLGQLNENRDQSNLFTSLMLSESKDKAYIISSNVDDAQEVIGVLQDTTLSETEKINRLQGSGDYLPSQAKAMVVEINQIKHKGTNNIPDEFGLLTNNASVVQGQGTYERIIKNNLRGWVDKKDPTKYYMSIQNDYNDALRSLLTRKTPIADAILERNYAIASSIAKKGIDNVLMGMSAYSGWQTVKTVDGYQRVLIPNINDILQTETINTTDTLKDYFMFLLRSDVGPDGRGLGEMGQLFAKFSPYMADGQRLETIQQLHDVLDGVNGNSYDTVAFEDFWRRHLFNGNFYTEQEEFSNNMKGTFMDYIYKRTMENENTPTSTKDIISYYYNNQKKFSQVIKENETKRGMVSLVNRAEYDPYGNFVSTQRPTTLQQLATMWYDRNLAKSYYDANKLLDRDFTIGNVVENNRSFELKQKYAKEISDGLSGRFNSIPIDDIDQNMTGYVKQISDIEIARAYEKINDINKIMKSIAKYGTETDDLHLARVEAMDRLFRQTFVSTYDSAEFILPELANMDHFSSKDLHVINLQKIDPKIASNFNITRVTDKMLLGKTENGNNIYYHGPNGTIENTKEFLETGKLRVLPDEIQTGAIKTQLYGEKGTASTILFDKNNPLFDPFIVKDAQGEIDLVETNKIINHFSSQYFIAMTGDKKSLIAGNMELSKHSSGDIVYGGFINRLGFEYRQTKNEKGFNELVNKFNLGNYLQYKNGIITNKVEEAPNGARNAIEDMFRYIQENQDKEKEFASTVSNYLDDIANNRVMVGIARTRLQDTLGDVVAINDKMAQTIRFIGRENIKEGLNATNSIELADGTRRFVSDFIADTLTINHTLTDAEKGARRTVSGIGQILKHMYAPDELLGSSIAVSIDAKDVYIPKAGSNISDLSESFYTYNGKASDFIRSHVDNAIADDIQVAVIDLKKYKPGFTYHLGEGEDTVRGLTSIAIPLIDITPTNGEVFYTPMQNAINNLMRLLQTSNNENVISQAVMDLNNVLAQEVSGATDSYMTKKVIKSIHQNGAQVQAKRTLNTSINYLVKHPEIANDKDAVKTIADAVKRATEEGMEALKGLKLDDKVVDLTLDDISLYDPAKRFNKGYQGVYLRQVGDKLQLDNIVELSEQSMRDMNINFNRVGQDVITNLNSGKLSYIDNLKVTNEMLQAYGQKFKKHLDMLSDDIVIDNFYKRGLIEDVYRQSITNQFFDLIDKYNLAPEENNIDDILNNILKLNNINSMEEFNKQYSLLQHDFLSLAGYSNYKQVMDEIGKIKLNAHNEIGIVIKGYEEVGKQFLEQYGIYGLGTRHPTFNEGHSGVVILRLNRFLSGRTAIQTPWLSAIENADYDGDTLFEIAMINKHGGLLGLSNVESDNNTLFALQKTYNMLSEKMGTNFKNQIEKITNSEKANILDSKFRYNDVLKWGINKEYTIIENGEKITKTFRESDIQDLIEAAKSGDAESIKNIENIARQWSANYDNMLKNEEVIAATIKSKVTKGNIGYISNSNYALRNSMLSVYDDALKTGNATKLADINRIKKDLVNIEASLFGITEQKGIDTKHIIDAMTVAKTMQYQKAIADLMRKKPTNGIKEKAIGQIYDAMHGNSRLFTSDYFKRAGILDSKNLRKATIDRIMNTPYENMQPEERMIKSLLDLSENNVARKKFNSVLATGKIRNNLKNFVNKMFSEENQGFDGSTASQIVTLMNEKGDLKRFGIKTEQGFKDLSKENYYFTINKNGAIKAHSIKDITRNKKGQIQITMNHHDIGKRNGGKIITTSSNDVIIGSSVDEINQIMTRRYGKIQPVSKLMMNRRNDFYTEEIENISKINAKSILKRKTMNLSEYTPMIDNTFDNTVMGTSTKVNQYLSMVSKKDIRQFEKRIDYLFKNQNTEKIIGNKTFQDSVSMHSYLLDKINEAIINDSAINNGMIEAKRKAQNAKFSRVFDYYFNELVSPVRELDKKIADSNYSFTPLKNSFQDIVAEYKQNSYNIDDATHTIENLFDTKTNGTTLENDLNAKATILKNEITRLKGVNDAARNDAFNVLRQSINPTNVTNDVKKYLGDNPINSIGENYVGFGEYFGQQIKNLDKETLEKIINYEITDSTDEISIAIIKKTQDDASIALSSNQFRKKSEPIVGDYLYDLSDSNSLLDQINDDIEKAGEKAAKGATSTNKAAKEKATNDAGKIISKNLSFGQDIKSFFSGKGKYVGKAIAAVAAIGLVSNLLQSKSSPLAPDGTPNSQTTVSKNQIKTAKQTYSNLKQEKVIYDKGNNIGFNISAKGARKIDKMQSARMLGAQSGSSVDVHTYDDRSRVSNNWLERKFLELT